MNVLVDLGALARARIRALGGDAARDLVRIAAPLARNLAPTDATRADVDVMVRNDRPVGLEELGDAGDGLRTIRGDGRLHVEVRRGWYSLPSDLAAGIVAGRELPVAALWGAVLRPALFALAAPRGAAALHAAAVTTGDRTLVLAGWAEAGKTECALAFLEDGASTGSWSLLADKWVILGPDRTPIPIPAIVHVRAWVLEHLPALRRALGRGARVRGQVGALAARVPGLLDRAGGPGTAAADAFAPLAAIAGRSRLSVQTVNALLGRPAVMTAAPPVTDIALLRTVPRTQPIQVRPASPSNMLEALAASSAFERRAVHALLARARAMRDPTVPAWLDTLDAERANLARLLPGIRLHEVDTPFPEDPRRVRDAIATWLA